MIPPFAQPSDSESQNARPQEGASGRRVPPDFLAEEEEFARTLQTAFPLEQEEIPPLFFQTLHGGREYSLAGRDLEQTIASHVFQRLELPLPPAPATATRREHRSLRGRLPLRLPHAMGLGALFAVLLLGLVVGAPVLAQMALGALFQAGSHSSPAGTRVATLVTASTSELPWREAERVVPFTVYWLGRQSVDYAFQSMRLRLEEDWVAGPLVESQYGIIDGNTTVGRVLVREFQPSVGNTILLTAEEAAVQVFQSGGQPVIYIDGQWGYHDEQQIWEYGSQAELLYVEHGLLFWIIVQRPEGAAPQTLQQIADALEALYYKLPYHAVMDTYVPPMVQLAPALPHPQLVGGSTQIEVSIAEQGAPIVLRVEQPST